MYTRVAALRKGILPLFSNLHRCPSTSDTSVGGPTLIKIHAYNHKSDLPTLKLHFQRLLGSEMRLKLSYKINQDENKIYISR